MLAHSRGCWRRGSCFPLAGSTFPELLWMPLCSLPLQACPVRISYAWQKPLQMRESPSTPWRRGFAFPLLVFWDSSTSLCCYQEFPIALSPSAGSSPAWSSTSHKEHHWPAWKAGFCMGEQAKPQDNPAQPCLD